MPFFITMCELFNGILQPHRQMPAFWKYTMYYLTPFTYWIGGVLSSVLRGMPVTCEESELAVFQSPSNMTCEEYAGRWLSAKGMGYLSNPEDHGLCGYCEYSYGDDVGISDILFGPDTMLTKSVSLHDRTGLIQDLAVPGHLREFRDYELRYGLFIGLPPISDEVVWASLIRRYLIWVMPHTQAMVIDRHDDIRTFICTVP